MGSPEGTRTFTAALRIAPKPENTRCPSTGKRVRKLWCTHPGMLLRHENEPTVATHDTNASRRQCQTREATKRTQHHQCLHRSERQNESSVRSQDPLGGPWKECPRRGTGQLAVGAQGMFCNLMQGWRHGRSSLWKCRRRLSVSAFLRVFILPSKFTWERGQTLNRRTEHRAPASAHVWLRL